MAQRILDIQGYSGGEADTLYRGPANSFYQGENIEIRKDLTGFSLSPLLTDTGWTFDDSITCIVNLKTLGVSSGGIVVCLENGKIYLNGTLKHTLNTGTSTYNRIYGIGMNNISGTDYLYYISGSSFGTFKIHRSTTNLTTWDDNYLEADYPSGNPGFVGIINDVGLLYIAVQNKVFILDNDEILTEQLVLPPNETIKGFTQYLGNYRIYTNSTNVGIQYIWNGVSELATTRQEWLNQPILGVVNDGAIDYATLGFSESYSDLYLIQGTQKQELRVNLETASYARVLNGYLSIREGIVYISGGLTGESSNYGIYTYNNYYPGTAKSLVQSYSGTTSKFLGHCHDTAASYFACSDNKVYSIEHNNPPSAFATTGYIYTLMYEGGVWEELSLDKIKIAHKTNGGSIKIYARTNADAQSPTSFTLIKTITDTQVKKTYIDINEIIGSGVTLGTFNEIQFKLEIVRGGTATVNPIIKRFTAWCNINNNS